MVTSSYYPILSYPNSPILSMTDDPLRILFWNANGIEHKINELSALTVKNKLDVILLSETRLLPNKHLKIPNYITYRTDKTPRPCTPQSGGTAILVHRRITHREISLNTSITTTSIDISTDLHPIRITSVYKSPTQKLKTEDLDKITNNSGYLIGDLNSKHPLWNSYSANSAGNFLYRHYQNSDYSIIAPDTSTHFPPIIGHRPDVLDIALINLLLQ